MRYLRPFRPTNRPLRNSGSGVLRGGVVKARSAANAASERSDEALTTPSTMLKRVMAE